MLVCIAASPAKICRVPARRWGVIENACVGDRHFKGKFEFEVRKKEVE